MSEDRQTRNIDRVIDRLLEITDSDFDANKRRSIWERSFALLLDSVRDQLPEMSDRFHKTFRQVDVFESGSMDMAVWWGLQVSKAFWQAYEEIEETMEAAK